MADIRVKDLSNTATTVAADAFHVVDGVTNGTEKISRDNLRADLAGAFEAAPGTYNLAPLVGGAVAVARGGTGSTTAAGARTNLEVNSKDEDAQANALKVTAPALYFNGSSSVVTVADDSKFTFSDGTDDLPLTISGWINVASNAVNFSLFAMWYNFREVIAYVDTNGKLTFGLADGTNDTYALGSTTIPLNQWTHVSICYAGAGPNSANGFDANQNGTTMYVNGKAETVTPTNNNNYGGLVERTQAQLIGGYGSYFGKGSIRDVKIFNRELTADEVAELARGNDLGFSEEWGGALGGVFTQDSTPSGEFAGVNLTDADEAGPIGGKSNILKLTVNTASGVLHYATFSGASGTAGKRLRLKCYAYVPSANSNTDGIWIYQSSGSGKQEQSITPDTWVPLEFEFVSNGNVMVVAMLDGTSSSFADAGSDDILYLADLTVTQIGTLADFRSERYDTSTSKLYDNSDNAFVGTGTSVSLTGREVPVYTTGTWTPVYSPSSGSFTALTMDVTDATYTRVGNIVTVSANIKTDDVDVTGASGNLQITGLPFTANGIAAGSTAFTNNWTTHPVACWVSDNSNTMFLGKQASLGGSTTAVQVSDMQDGTVANANNVYITATYQIQ